MDEDNKELVVTDGKQFFVYHHNRNILTCPMHAAMKRQALVLHNMAITGYIYILAILKLCMVLAVMVAHTLSAKDEVWLAFGTRKSF